MQNCTTAAHRKFQREPKKLIGTWVIRMNRLHARDELCEIVAVQRGMVLLMQVGREVRPVYVLEKPPEAFEVSLRGLLDPDSGFSYLGARRKFAWIVPNVMVRRKGRHEVLFQVTSTTGPRVYINFVPPMYLERVRHHLANLPPGPHSERFPTFRDMWIWELASNYERAVKVSASEWRQQFAREHPEIDLENHSTKSPESLPAAPTEPEHEGPRGQSVWERLRTPEDTDA